MTRAKLTEVVLGGGVSDAARLRGWYRRIALGRHGVRGRIRWAVRAAVWPVRAAKQSREAVEAWGAPVAEAQGIGRVRQAWQQWRFALQTGLEPKHYYSFRLFEPTWRGRTRELLGSEQMHYLLTALAEHQGAEEAAMLSDKALFAQWCHVQGFTTPRVIALFRSGERIEADLPVEAPLPPRDLFSKPVEGKWGAGVGRWRWLGDGQYRDERGRSLSGEEVESVLSQESQDQSVLLQERLVNHPHLVGLSGNALSTVRIVTGRSPGGQARALMAIFRMPVGASPVDNIASGGLGAAVDLASGRLGHAVGFDPARCTERFAYHPDTGAPLAGTILPYWPEVVALAERAHDALERVASVGWDVAILEGGPVLIEANVSWGVSVLQAAAATPITATPFAQQYLTHIREVYR